MKIASLMMCWWCTFWLYLILNHSFLNSNCHVSENFDHFVMVTLFLRFTRYLKEWFLWRGPYHSQPVSNDLYWTISWVLITCTWIFWFDYCIGRETPHDADSVEGAKFCPTSSRILDSASGNLHLVHLNFLCIESINLMQHYIYKLPYTVLIQHWNNDILYFIQYVWID